MGSNSGETYDKNSENSILSFARLIIGKSVADASDKPQRDLRAEGKGGLGVLVETAFFDLPKSNKPEPDFAEVGLELKTTGLKVSKDGVIKAKESLKLTSLNAKQVDLETWETSRVVSKCGRMLVLTYWYEKKKLPMDLKFTEIQIVLDLLDEKSVDGAQFKRDFEKIKGFIRAGRTQELSSGDTLYLIAKTSGPGKGKGWQSQPHSKELHSPRSFMIRDTYMSQLIAGSGDHEGIIAKPDMSLEDATDLAFAPWIGKSVKEISSQAKFFGSTATNKSYHRNLVVRLLGDGKNTVPEFTKANILLKTIRLTKSGRMREEMSFRQFKYLEIEKEEWEESIFHEELQRKFLFVIFKELDDGSEVLFKTGYWNMPFKDRQEAKAVWEETKKRVQSNDYHFPKISETTVAHVRPHGANRLDTFPTPQGGQEPKNGFWLNRSYLKNVIDELPVNN